MTTTPEYTPEQVATAVMRLQCDLARDDLTNEEWYGTDESCTVVSKDDIRTILSALSRAEQDSKPLDWMQKHGTHQFARATGWSAKYGDYSHQWMLKGSDPVDWKPCGTLRNAIDAALNPSTESTNG